MAVERSDYRLVRPWIAAALSVFGWALGFYYARLPRHVFWALVAQAVLPAAIVASMVGLLALGPRIIVSPVSVPAVFLGLAALLYIAPLVLTWIIVGRSPRRVPKAGPVRLLGYAAIWLLCVIVSGLSSAALRWTWMQPFRIPAASMQPALQVGDYVFASKSAFGYSRFSFSPYEGLLPNGRWRAAAPQRGDIVVFRPPNDPSRDFVKRVIGLPRDRIQLRNGALLINDVSASRESTGIVMTSDHFGGEAEVPAFVETLPNGVRYTILDRKPDSPGDETRTYTVPANAYFMLGDDRDNSVDSRPETGGFGAVPAEYLVGRVDHIIRDH